MRTELLTQKRADLLRDLHSSRGKAPIGARGRALKELRRRGLVDEKNRVTEAGREALREFKKAS